MEELKDEFRGTKDDFWAFARMERASKSRRNPGLLAASKSDCREKQVKRGSEMREVGTRGGERRTEKEE